MLTFLITQRKNKRIRNPQESSKPYCFEKYISALKKIHRTYGQENHLHLFQLSIF